MKNTWNAFGGDRARRAATRRFRDHIAEVGRLRAIGAAPPALTSLPSGPYAGVPLADHPLWFLEAYMGNERVTFAVAEAVLTEIFGRVCGPTGRTIPDALANHAGTVTALIDAINWEEH